MGKFNDKVKYYCGLVGKKHKWECTSWVQQDLLYPIYGWNNSFMCPTGWAIDYLRGKVPDILKYFEVIDSGNVILHYGDILVWEKFNKYGHSAINLEDGVTVNLEVTKKQLNEEDKTTNMGSTKCISGNYRGSFHFGDNVDLPNQISITKHALYGLSGVLRPIENTLPYVCLDYATSQKNGKLRVSGWSFDKKNLGKDIDIHIYSKDHKIFYGVGTTSYDRKDVDNVYNIVGARGFDFEVDIDKSIYGDIDVVVAAIDTVDVNKHTWSNNKAINVKEQKTWKVGDYCLCLQANNQPDSNDYSKMGYYGNGIKVKIKDLLTAERATYNVEIQGDGKEDIPRFTKFEWIKELN